MPRHCGDARRKDVVVRKAVCMPPVPVRGGTRVTERHPCVVNVVRPRINECSARAANLV